MQSRVSIGQVMVKVRSAKQIEASQKNGLKGSGPISPIGKLRSSMNAFKHTNFWQCMDNLRDKNSLIDLWDSGKAPWKLWED